MCVLSVSLGIVVLVVVAIVNDDDDGTLAHPHTVEGSWLGDEEGMETKRFFFSENRNNFCDLKL